MIHKLQFEAPLIGPRNSTASEKLFTRTGALHGCGIESEMTINSETDHVKLKEIGNEAFKKGDFELALDAYTKAMDIAKEEKIRQEDFAILYKNRAAVHLKSEDFQCAVEDCTKALDLVREVDKCLPQGGLIHGRCYKQGAKGIFLGIFRK